MKRSTYKWFESVSLLAGLGLLAYLLKQTGLGVLAGYILMLGWGSLLILGLSALRNCARAGSWYFAIEPEHRAISFWSLINIMLAGEAIKYLTATGPLLGEPAKAGMMRGKVPLRHGVSSVAVENLTYYLTVIILMLMGLPALAWLVEMPDRLELAVYLMGAGVAVVTAIAWLAIRRRWYWMSGLMAVFAQKRGARAGAIHQARLLSLVERVRGLEESVYTFYERRRGAFYLIFGLNISAHLVNVVEVVVILSLMGIPASLPAGFVIEAVTKLINMAFFFVPARAGVYESGNAVVLGALDMGTSAGLALAIIRKIRAFVWAGYGLGVLALMALKRRRAEEPKKQPAVSAD